MEILMNSRVRSLASFACKNNLERKKIYLNLTLEHQKEISKNRHAYRDHYLGERVRFDPVIYVEFQLILDFVEGLLHFWSIDLNLRCSRKIILLLNELFCRLKFAYSFSFVWCSWSTTVPKCSSWNFTVSFVSHNWHILTPFGSRT